MMVHLNTKTQVPKILHVPSKLPRPIQLILPHNCTTVTSPEESTNKRLQLARRGPRPDRCNKTAALGRGREAPA